MKDKIILGLLAGVTMIGGITLALIIRRNMKLDEETKELDRATNESIDRVTEIIVKQGGVEALDQCKDEIVRSYIKSISKNSSRILTVEEREIVECEITKSIDRVKKRHEAI